MRIYSAVRGDRFSQDPYVRNTVDKSDRDTTWKRKLKFALLIRLWNIWPGCVFERPWYRDVLRSTHSRHDRIYIMAAVRMAFRKSIWRTWYIQTVYRDIRYSVTLHVSAHAASSGHDRDQRGARAVLAGNPGICGRDHDERLPGQSAQGSHGSKLGQGNIRVCGRKLRVCTHGSCFDRSHVAGQLTFVRSGIILDVM